MNLLNTPWEKKTIAKRSVWDKVRRACTHITPEEERYLRIPLNGTFDSYIVSIFYSLKNTYGCIPEYPKTPSIVLIYPNGIYYRMEKESQRTSLFRNMVYALNNLPQPKIRDADCNCPAIPEVTHIRKSTTKDTPPLIVELLRGGRYRVVAYEHIFTGRFSTLMKDFDSTEYYSPADPPAHGGHYEYYDEDGYHNKLIAYFLQQCFYKHFFSQYVPPNKRYNSAHYMAALQTIYENPACNPADIAATMFPQNPSETHMWMLKNCYREQFRSALVSASRGTPLEMAMSLHGLELA